MLIVSMAVFMVLVWSAYRTLSLHSHTAMVAPSPSEGATRVARDRLLQGEISAEEYDRIASVLRS